MTDLMEGPVDRVQDVYPTRLRSPEPPTQREDPVVWGTAAEGPMDASSLASYDERGYLTIEELVTPEEVETFRAELRRLSEDPTVRADARTIVERQSQEVRSVFEVHKVSDVFAKLAHDPRVVDRARQILGYEVYIHQSRVNFKPRFDGKEFYWHSDFETWHAEDGMPRMRAVSISISLTDNYSFNGPLMIMPGSHWTYVSCVGEMPDDNYKSSLVQQVAGTPDQRALSSWPNATGSTCSRAGSAARRCSTATACTVPTATSRRSHGRTCSSSNNSVENICVEPFGAAKPRPEFIARATSRRWAEVLGAVAQNAPSA